MIVTDNGRPLEVDLDMAAEFLRHLDPGGTFTFQTFPEGKATGYPRILHGTFNQHVKELVRLNRNGYGIFVMVNKGDGIIHEGNNSCRATESVIAVRALFVDLDGASPAQLLEVKPQPGILVTSSPGKYHAYWLVDDCPLDHFTHLQKKLAEKFSGDISVSDLPRVMRLPGFFHNKREPFLTRLIGPEDIP